MFREQFATSVVTGSGDWFELSMGTTQIRSELSFPSTTDVAGAS